MRAPEFLVFCLGSQILNFHSRAFLKLFFLNKIPWDAQFKGKKKFFFFFRLKLGVQTVANLFKP